MGRKENSYCLLAILVFSNYNELRYEIASKKWRIRYDGKGTAG